MKVVQKIKSLGYYIDMTFCNDYDVCRIYRGKNKTIPSCCIIEETVWQACVQFIVWWNNQNKQG